MNRVDVRFRIGIEMQPALCRQRTARRRRPGRPVCSMPIAQRGGLGWSRSPSRRPSRIAACGSAPGRKSRPLTGPVAPGPASTASVTDTLTVELQGQALAKATNIAMAATVYLMTAPARNRVLTDDKPRRRRQPPWRRVISDQCAGKRWGPRRPVPALSIRLVEITGFPDPEPRRRHERPNNGTTSRASPQLRWHRP
jgi:hypothetical protein